MKLHKVKQTISKLTLKVFGYSFTLTFKKNPYLISIICFKVCPNNPKTLMLVLRYALLLKSTANKCNVLQCFLCYAIPYVKLIQRGFVNNGLIFYYPVKPLALNNEW